MATYTVTEVLARLTRLPEVMANTAVEIMKDEIRISTNGPGIPVHLADTVRAERLTDNTYVVGTHKYPSTDGGNGAYYGIREVGAIIRKGRPALRPKHKSKSKNRPPALRWEDPFTGEEIFRYSVGPAAPNDFVTRTKNRLEHLEWTLEGGK